MKCSKILAPIAIASIFAASSFAATEEVLKEYGAITIKKVTYQAPQWGYSGDMVDFVKTVAFIDDESKVTPVIAEDVKVDSVYFNRSFKKSVYYTLMLPFRVKSDMLMYKTTVNGNTTQRQLSLFQLVDVTPKCQEGTVCVVARREYATWMEPNMPYLAISESGDMPYVGVGLTDVHDMTYITLNTTTNEKYRRYNGPDNKYVWDFIGTYESIEFKNPKGVYGFAAVAKPDGTKIGDFKRAVCKDDQCASIRPFRAYLKAYVPSLLKSADDVELPETIGVYLIDDDGKGTTYIGQMNTYTGEVVKEDNRWFDMKGRVLDHKPTTKGTYYNNKKKVIIK